MTYATTAKAKLLGVPAALIAKYGVVSRFDRKIWRRQS
ncbi:hypothetical protein [Lactobacillus helveticus]